MAEGVAGDVLDVAAAGADDGAVGEDDLEPQDGVAGLAVLHAAQAAGVRAEVPADRALLVAGGIRGVEEAPLGDGLLERRIDDSGLDDRDKVALVDLDDAVHPREGDRQGALDAGGSSAEARAGAARDDRHAMARGELHDPGHLCRLRRQGDGERQAGPEIGRLVVPI